MRDYMITYKEGRGYPVESRGLRWGSRKDAEASATYLLDSLREDNRGATVYIDGKRFTPEKEKQL